MKRQFAFLWVAFAILVAFSACNPSYQATQPPTSALVRIECHNASIQQIVEILRMGRGKDISVANDGSYVTAAFSPEDTPPGRLAQILQSVQGLVGVLRVDVQENPRPIRQSF